MIDLRVSSGISFDWNFGKEYSIVRNGTVLKTIDDNPIYPNFFKLFFN